MQTAKALFLSHLCFKHMFAGAMSFLLCSSCAIAQLSSTASADDTCGAKHLKQCVTDILHDQAGIWTSPFHMHSSDAAWLVPFAGATAAAIYYDSDALRQLGTNQNRVNISEDISRFGSPEATIGEGIGLYAIGSFSKNPKLAETGRLGAEAVVDASIVTEAVKLVANRDRPNQGEQNGEFWPSGTKGYSTNGSFPSGHATAAWALARVVGEEYTSFVPRLLAYGFATAVSIARVTGREHYPSDVLVGSGIGFLTGGYVYHHHAAHGESHFMIQPMVDMRTRTAGVQASIPVGDLGRLLRSR
jgi:membrane-associated phospholipid phosphatase